MYTFKERINAKGVKVTWLAEKIGIPRPTLSSYLNKHREMPDNIKNKLNQLLK